MKTIKQYLLTPDFPLAINVIGCGGTGSHFVMLLARMVWAYNKIYNKRRISVILWDGDTVSESNISRQCFTPGELHLNKAEALVSRYNRMYGYEWIAYPFYFNENQFQKIQGNIYISFVDTVSARRSIHNCFKRSVLPKHIDDFYNRFLLWIDAGNAKNTSNIFCSTIDQKTILDYYPNLKDDIETPSCSTIEALQQQSLFINVLTADITAKLLWDAIYENKEMPNVVYFNSQTLTVKRAYETDNQS